MPGHPVPLRGTLAARPAATDVPDGTRYIATDEGTNGYEYEAVGTDAGRTWVVSHDHAGGGSGGASVLDDLTDVDTTTTVPTDGQALVYDDASGLWVPGTVSGGGGGGSARTLIDSWDATVDGAMQPIVFSSIPSTYDELILVVLDLGLDTTGPWADLRIRLGTGGTIDTGSNYQWFHTRRYNTSGNAGSISATYMGTASNVVSGNGTGAYSFFPNMSRWIFPGYARTGIKAAVNEHVLSQGIGNAVSMGDGWGYWSNTGPVDTLHVITSTGDNFSAGRVELYGA